jgi:predicted rRNA methylase YqxC with S4 and FtsJ domains
MKFENKISKKSNLIENDSLSIYNNWAAQQNWNAFEVFHNFLEKVKPKRIIEIGTSLGGFTSFLNYTCKKLNLDCHILSYDIITHHWYDEMRKNGIDLRIENIFYNNYTTTKKEVIDFIQKDGLTLILW